MRPTMTSHQRKSGKIEVTSAVNTSSTVSYMELANAIRILSMDAVETAQSGHPGMPMGMADVATVLYAKFLKFLPQQPNWPSRDRLVVSNGHGSMLLYSLAYLTGYESIDIDQIKKFRKLGSNTPGHPELDRSAGIETTTGPLGQGLGNAVGMAIAERHLSDLFGEGAVGHTTYAMVGDGCLMEGISHEAISLAGHLKLAKLIVLFDDNEISIDGPTKLTTGDDTQARFAASNWETLTVDGHDFGSIAAAIDAARDSDRPSLIACRTIIGFGAPNKQGKSTTHGAPLGPEEVAAARQKLKWKGDPFVVPAQILDAWREIGKRGKTAHETWKEGIEALPSKVRNELERRLAGRLPDTLERVLTDYKGSLLEELSGSKLSWATRKSSNKVLETVNKLLPETIGGSSDLTGSNNTLTPELRVLDRDNYGGRYIHYGVREHLMAAVMNGIALHGGIIPYGGTFLVFSDYMRPAIRLSALMGQQVIYVLTHDSIGLGEDGPTHQPVEHLASLRAIPHLHVLRPADIIETTECWHQAICRRNGPSAIILTRQGVPLIRSVHTEENLCAKGGYELVAAQGKAKITLFASGSEVALVLVARDILQNQGHPTRVVSMPCQELFNQQNADYQEQVIQPETVRIAAEAAIGLGWERYVGENGAFVGLSTFGASAPGNDVYQHFGITPQAIVEAACHRLLVH